MPMRPCVVGSKTLLTRVLWSALDDTSVCDLTPRRPREMVTLWLCLLDCSVCPARVSLLLRVGGRSTCVLRSFQKIGHTGRLTSKVALYHTTLASVLRDHAALFFSFLTRVVTQTKVRVGLQHILQGSRAHKTNVVLLHIHITKVLEILERTRQSDSSLAADLFPRQ